MRIARPGGRAPSIFANGSNLIGLNPTIETHHVINGHLKMEPIRGDYFRTSSNLPQVFC